MARNMNILITEPVHPAGIRLLKDNGFHIIMGTGYTQDILLKEAAAADGVLTRNGQFTKQVMESCPKLKVISMHGVGVDCIDVEAASSLDIQVTNAADANYTSVSECTIGLLLALARQFPRLCRGLKEGNWDIRGQVYGQDVKGMTLGILGTGKIGTDVAKKAFHGLDMKVIGYKRGLKSPVQTDYGILTGDIRRVLSQADYLSLHLPYTRETYHFLDREKLDYMKPGACVLNLGRGETIDQAALIRALESGKLKGAALDVFEDNIPSPDNPLLRMDHVIATPHIGGLSMQAMEQMSYEAALGIVEVLKGMPVSYPVNEVVPVPLCGNG